MAAGMRRAASCAAVLLVLGAAVRTSAESMAPGTEMDHGGMDHSAMMDQGEMNEPEMKEEENGTMDHGAMMDHGSMNEPETKEEENGSMDHGAMMDHGDMTEPGTMDHGATMDHGDMTHSAQAPKPAPMVHEQQHGASGAGHSSAASTAEQAASADAEEPPSNTGLPCNADSNNRFWFDVDFARTTSMSGAYRVIGCEGVSPALVMVRGVEYEFVQSAPNNWMHPLSFGYYPDAPYIGAPELSVPGAAGHAHHNHGSSVKDPAACAALGGPQQQQEASADAHDHTHDHNDDFATFGHRRRLQQDHSMHGGDATGGAHGAGGEQHSSAAGTNASDPCAPKAAADCTASEWLCDPGVGIVQVPLHCVNGVCQTVETVANDIISRLDNYIPSFKQPFEEWEKNQYSTKLTIPLGSLTKQLFYYCHVHSGMTGAINVADPPPFANELTEPWDPAAYYGPPQSDFDQACGTGNISDFHYRADEFCPDQKFLCDPQDDIFSNCMQAIGCKMNYEMRVEETDNTLTLFMHQMIPHHLNAIEMSKIALKVRSATPFALPQAPWSHRPAWCLLAFLSASPARPMPLRGDANARERCATPPSTRFAV